MKVGQNSYKVQFSSVVSDEEWLKSSVRLVSDNAQVRSITTQRQCVIIKVTQVRILPFISHAFHKVYLCFISRKSPNIIDIKLSKYKSNLTKFKLGLYFHNLKSINFLCMT